MSDDDHDPVPTAADRVAADGLLAWLARGSLHKEAQRTVWQLGALARRVEREAPEVYPRLQAAAEALQLVCARLALRVDANDRPRGDRVVASPTSAGPRVTDAAGGDELR